jgi:hypothetical protein
LPVSLITDRDVADVTAFDRVIVVDSHINGMHQGAPWRNLGRYRAYDYSPYQQTLLLDADYVICSDVLGSLFSSKQDILSMRWAYDVTNRQKYQDSNYFGNHMMPSAWATVIYWQKSPAAKMVFDMIKMVENHWQHYKNIYGINEHRFRNDHALAIASNTVFGHVGYWPNIPWAMAMVDKDCEISQIDNGHFEIKYLDKHQKPKKTQIKNQDFHVMGKRQLGEIIGSRS